jgi:hypothetical protein
MPWLSLHPRRSVFLLVMVILLITVGWIVTRSIAVINCTVTSLTPTPCPDTISTTLAPLRGQRLFFQTLSELNQKFSVDSSYQVLSFQPELPHTLHIVLTEEPMIYVIELPDQSKWKVNKTGRAFSHESTSELPTVIVHPEVAQLLDRDQSPALITPLTHEFISKTLQGTQEYHLKYDRFEILSSSSARLQLSQPYPLTVLMPVEASSRPIHQLHLVVSQIKLAELDSALKVLDLRFKLPVLKQGE